MSATFDPAEILAHAEGVRSLARRLAGDDHAGDDVVQEACLVALTHPPAAGTPGRAWFVGVVRHLVHRLRRGDTRRSRRECAAARPEAVQPTAQAANEIEAHRRVVEAVAVLSDPYRTAIVFRYLDGLTPREIAARLGVPDATVRTWIHRGLGMLRTRLASGRDDWRAALLPLLALPRKTVPPLVPVAGAIAMSVKKVLVVVAAVLLLAAGGWGVRSMMSGSANSTSVPTEVAVQRSRAPRTKSPPAEELVAISPDVPLPAPVDLDKCDVDLDLCGVVVDPSGAPIAGADVATVAHPWRRLETLNLDGRRLEIAGPRTRTAVDGTISMRLARGALVDLNVRAQGRAEIRLQRRQAGERVRVVLPRGVSLVVATKDEAGAVVQGARVRLFRAADAGDPDFEREAVTDAGGRCRFDALPSACSGVIDADTSTSSLSWKQIVLPESGESVIDVVLVRGRSVRGRVVDADTSTPLAGARVGVGWTLRQAVTSRADGAYDLLGVPSDVAEIHAASDGYARGQAKAGDDGVVDIALHRGIGVRGRVVGATGDPIVGALVSVIASWSESGTQELSLAHASTDEGGRFSVSGLAPDRAHALVMWATGYARLRRILPAAAAAAGVLDQGDIVLGAPRTIEGVVLDGAGAPAVRVAVRLWGPRATDSDKTSDFYGIAESRMSDDLGRFRFPDLAEGDYQVTARLPDRTDTTASVHVPLDRDVLDVKLLLPSMRGLVVHVRDDAGDPVAGAEVMWDPIPPGTPHPRTDATGTVRAVVPMPTRTVCALAAYEDPRAFLPSGWGTLPSTPGPVEITLTVRRAAKISGTLLDPEGRPIPGVSQVRARSADGSRTNAVTDANGRFSMNVPREGLSTVTFAAEVAVGAPKQVTALVAKVEDVAPGTNDLVLRATRVARGLHVVVRLVTADGRPVVGGWVGARGLPADSSAGGKTDADGRVTLDGLPEWEHSISTSGAFRAENGFPPKPVTVVPAGQEITLRNRASAPITGTIEDAAGRPVRCGVALHLGNEYLASTGTDAEGRFSLPCPVDERGPYTVKPYRYGADASQIDSDAKDLAPGATGVRIVLR